MDVASAVRELAPRCDVVVVTCSCDTGLQGNVLAGVAGAFGLRLVPSAPDLCVSVPEGAELLAHVDGTPHLMRLSIRSCMVFLALGAAPALKAHLTAIAARLDDDA